MELLHIPDMFLYTDKDMGRIREMIIMLFLLFLSLTVSYSQDEITRYDKILNPWVLNPALTGLRNNSLNFYVNKQWLGFQGSPSFFGFHINGRLAPFDFYTNRMYVNKTNYKSRGNVGLGASIIRDENGPLSYSELKLIYSYHIALSGGGLSFGLSNDFEIYGIHENEMNPLVPNDPRIEGIHRSKIFYNPGIGIVYNTNLLETGLSLNNIAGEKLILKDDYIEFHDNMRILSVIASYRLQKTENLLFRPQIIIGTHAFDDFLYTLTTEITLKKDYQLSLSYESLGYFVIHAGINLRKYFIVYGFSSPLGSLPKYIYGSHEIMLGLKFGSYIY